MHHHRNAHRAVGAPHQARIARGRGWRQLRAQYIRERHAATLEQRALFEHRRDAITA